MSDFHERLNLRAWATVRRDVLVRDRYRCRACGKARRLEVDHIRPLRRGGAPYELANLQALCGGPQGCHAAKTAKENGKVRTRQEREWLDFRDGILQE